MAKHYENPYLPGIEPVESSADADTQEQAEGVEQEQITVSTIRSLLRGKQLGKSPVAEAGKLFVFPNLDENYKEAFGFWEQLPDGKLRMTALEPEDQKIAQAIAQDEEIIGYRDGKFIYTNNDSQPKYKY